MKRITRVRAAALWTVAGIGALLPLAAQAAYPEKPAGRQSDSATSGPSSSAASGLDCRNRTAAAMPLNLNVSNLPSTSDSRRVGADP